MTTQTRKPSRSEQGCRQMPGKDVHAVCTAQAFGRGELLPTTDPGPKQPASSPDEGGAFQAFRMPVMALRFSADVPK
jgi:hypothetical protein